MLIYLFSVCTLNCLSKMCLIVDLKHVSNLLFDVFYWVQCGKRIYAEPLVAALGCERRVYGVARCRTKALAIDGIGIQDRLWKNVIGENSGYLSFTVENSGDIDTVFVSQIIRFKNGHYVFV